jgi:hypothetical protein
LSPWPSGDLDPVERAWLHLKATGSPAGRIKPPKPIGPPVPLPPQPLDRYYEAIRRALPWLMKLDMNVGRHHMLSEHSTILHCRPRGLIKIGETNPRSGSRLRWRIRHRRFQYRHIRPTPNRPRRGRALPKRSRYAGKRGAQRVKALHRNDDSKCHRRPCPGPGSRPHDAPPI